MVSIRISFEDSNELQRILEVLEPVMVMKSTKGYKANKVFQKRYISGDVKLNISQSVANSKIV